MRVKSNRDRPRRVHAMLNLRGSVPWQMPAAVTTVRSANDANALRVEAIHEIRKGGCTNSRRRFGRTPERYARCSGARVLGEHLHALEDFGDKPAANLRHPFDGVPRLDTRQVAECGLGNDSSGVSCQIRGLGGRRWTATPAGCRRRAREPVTASRACQPGFSIRAGPAKMTMPVVIAPHP